MLANEASAGERRHGASALPAPSGHVSSYDARELDQQWPASSSRHPMQGGAAAAGQSSSPSSVPSRLRREEQGSASPSAGPSAPSSPMPTTAASLMREGPRDFTVIRDVGDGSFGTVCLADWKSPLPSGTLLSPMQHPTTRPEYVGKRLVAIKKMKKPFPNWAECMKLKELKSLLAIPHHPNIIPLYDAFLMPGSKELHFVFECMEGNLYQLTKSRKGRPLAGGLVASIFLQIVHGLHHIHQHGYFHRDMKPENLLITTTGLADYPASSPLAMPGTPPEKDVLVIVKLADFGLARETQSRPPYTEYVSTRWYRAPEVLLRSRDYSNPVDMWALGTILAEMVNLKPLFPGQSEVDQVLQICEVLGDPTRDYGLDERGRRRGGGEWIRGIRMAKQVGFEYPMAQPITFSTLFSPKVQPSLVDCIQDLLRYDPQKRLTTSDCLRHTYCTKIAPSLLPPQARAVVSSTSPEEAAAMARQHTITAQAPQSFGAASRLAAADTSAAERSLPPSHSNASPHGYKPPFGAGHADAAQNARIAQVYRGDSDTQMGGASPMYSSTSGDVAFAPAPGRPHRDSNSSNYPSFPDSASAYASTTSHESGTRDDIAMERSDTYTNAVPMVFDRRQGRMVVDPAHLQDNALSNEDLEMVRTFDQAGVPSRPAMAPYDHRQYEYKDTSSTPSLVSQPGSTSSEPDLRPAGHVSSNETIHSKDRRKGKAWGLHMPAVLHSGKSIQQQGVESSAQSIHGSHSVQGGAPQGATPAQQIIAEQAAAKQLSPAEMKKAKKEADRAAKEAEKAKRAAQERAARERARAVLQKRNQILASSSTRDQVEWLSMAENDMTRALQQQQQAQQAGSQFGKITQEQPFPPLANQQRGHAQQHQGGFGARPPGQPVNFTQPHQPYHPHTSEKLWGKQPRLSSATSDHSSNSLYSGRLGNSYSPLPHNAALRPIDSGDEEYAGDPRRRSLISFQTRDSDPGPNRARGHSGTFMQQRPGSNTSLNSAPGLIDAATLAASHRSRYSERASADNASVGSSLDHQLITNMENMTAAESNAQAYYGHDYASPHPSQLGHNRQSLSRQSHGSHASQRQGSASPMHYTGAPRYHPYSGGGGPGSSHAGSGPFLPQSPHNTYPLPSLAASLAQQTGGAGQDMLDTRPGEIASSIGPTRPRSLSRRMSHGQGPHRGISQGSAASRDGSIRQGYGQGHFHPHGHGHSYGQTPGLPSSSGLGAQNSGSGVHPMFNVQQQQYPHNDSQQHGMTVLPPFAELAASTNVPNTHTTGDARNNEQMQSR